MKDSANCENTGTPRSIPGVVLSRGEEGSGVILHPHLPPTIQEMVSVACNSVWWQGVQICGGETGTLIEKPSGLCVSGCSPHSACCRAVLESAGHQST